MEIQVFVYGMLLGRATRPATLPGYRLGFNVHATVEADPDGQVLGGLITTNREGLWRYDAMEGVDPAHPTAITERGYYRRVQVLVELADGSTELAWVYVMNPSDRRPIPPGEHYVSMIRQGYQKFGYDESELDAAVEGVDMPALPA